jgi:hypothetical protein
MTRDFTLDGNITLQAIHETGTTHAIVSLEQATALYTELQHTVRWEDCADFDERGSFTGRKAYRDITIATVPVA